MKSLHDFFIESLSGIRFDFAQIFSLYTDSIDKKTFAINSKVTEEDAKWVSDILHSKDIYIISMEQMREKYSKDELDPISDNIDNLVEIGIRYGSQMDMSDDEKKQREEAEKNLGIESSTPEYDDSTLVNQVANDFIGIQPDNIEEYFWKKSGKEGYLVFVINSNDDIDKLINRL